MSEATGNAEIRALAERLTNYSDALAAVMIVGASGLAIALADPDIRSSLTPLAVLGIAAGNLCMGVGVTLLLRLLRRWELDLVSELPSNPKIERYSRYFYHGRHVVVWFCIFQNTVVLLLSGFSAE